MIKSMSWVEPSKLSRPDSLPEFLAGAPSDKRVQLQSHWRRFAKSLPRRARVLEVAAGSCLVSRWMLNTRPDLRIIAADSGDYSLDQTDLGRIKFLPRVALEELPFESGAFDAVVSQFGFEYASRAPALLACSRVIRQGGILSFVMHKKDGSLYDGCAFRVSAGEMVMQHPSIPDLLRTAAAIKSQQLRTTMWNLSFNPRLSDQRRRLTELETAAKTSSAGVRSYLETIDQMIHRPDFAEWAKYANESFELDLFIAKDQLRAAYSQSDVDTLDLEASGLGLRPRNTAPHEFYWDWGATKT